MLDCLIYILRKIGLSDDVIKQKLIGITTDGASENMGNKGGLWEKLKKWLERQILTVWCFCHRSDLAIEDLEESVSELGIWKSNLTSLASYYRKSGKKTKSLKKHGAKREFPAHHEVRFAQHLGALITAAIDNMEACKKHWNEISNTRGVDKKEKAKAVGFLKTWDKSNLQMQITVLMGDVLEIFQELQKQCQREHIILPDIFKYRDHAVTNLRLMSNSAYPGE